MKSHFCHTTNLLVERMYLPAYSVSHAHVAMEKQKQAMNIVDLWAKLKALFSRKNQV